MKRFVLNTIHSYLNGETVDPTVMFLVREEVNAEWERLNAKAQANRGAYDDAKVVAFDILCDTPMTVKDIYAKGEGLWPQGFTVAKVQYAFLHYWNDEIDKHDNGKSAYTYTLRV